MHARAGSSPGRRGLTSALDLPNEADDPRKQASAVRIVIVGAGVAGLSVGWRLAKAGAEVTVIERAEPGTGATGAAAGMIAVAGEVATSPGAERELSCRSAKLWPGFAKELEEASGHSISYQQNGALIISSVKDAGFSDREFAEPVDIARARLLEPMLTGEYGQILWAPAEAQVDNRALGPALATALGRAGGKLVRGDVIASLVRVQHRVVGVAGVRTRYRADAVVIAAGAWSAQIDGVPTEIRDNVKPIKGEMIALTPEDNSRRLTRVIRGDNVYLVPRGEGILAGATVADVGFDSSLSEDAARALLNGAVALAPALASWRVAQHWAGFRPATRDRLPLIGQTTSDGLFAATGQFRNGILFAPAMAEILAGIVLGRAATPSEFDPRRFAEGVDFRMPS